MDKLRIGLMRHMSQKEREWVETCFDVSITDTFDAMELAWENLRALENSCRSLLYGEQDPRSDLEIGYQDFRDTTKGRR